MIEGEFWFKKEGKKLIFNNETIKNHIAYLEQENREDINKIAQGNLPSRHGYFKSIARNHKALALGYIFIDSEQAIIIEHFKKAVEYYIIEQRFKKFIISDSINTLSCSILSRQKDLIIEVISLLNENPPISKYKPDITELRYYAILNFLNNRYNKQQKLEFIEKYKIVEVKEVRRIQGGIIGMGLALIAILEMNYELFLNGISQVLTKFHRAYKKYGRIPISEEVALLIFLARDKGMNISSELLRKNLPEKFLIHIKQTFLMD